MYPITATAADSNKTLASGANDFNFTIASRRYNHNAITTCTPKLSQAARRYSHSQTRSHPTRTAPTPAVAIVSKKDKKKPIKKKVKKAKEAKKVHIPHKPTIGELIQMPAKPEVKTEQTPHVQIATV
jgi:hypothetical protein